MIELEIHSTTGETGAKVAVDDQALGEVNAPLLREVIRAYESNRRVGTRHVRTRGEIASSGKKLYRQKHTGNARAGSRVANIRRGGGKAHAPGARDWTIRVPKKVRRAAVRSALLARLRDDEVSVVELPSLEAPSTRAIASVLKSAGFEGSCLLVIDGDADAVRTLWKSARNIAGLCVRRVADVNAYDLLASDRVIVSQTAFDAFMRTVTS